MKKLAMIALVALFGNLAQASFFVTTCATADGRISVTTGHNIDTTIRVPDWQTGGDSIEKSGWSTLEVIEEMAVIEESNNGGGDQCGIVSYEKTYVVKALVQLGEDASEKAKTFVGDEPKILLCEHHISGMAPPCDNN